jgi:hypothetical protein
MSALTQVFKPCFRGLCSALILATSLLAGGSACAQQDPSALRSLEEEAKSIVDRFEVTVDLITPDGIVRNPREIKLRYAQSQDFLIRVVNSPISPEAKGKLVFEVAEASGKMFNELTKHYIDVQPLEYKRDPNLGFFKDAGNAIVAYSKFFAQGVGRELGAIVKGRAIPFFGSDTKRTALVESIGKNIQKRFKEQAALVGTAEGKQGVAALFQVLEHFEKSEVARYGAFNNSMRWSYVILGAWQTFQPFTELPWERTTFSPIFAGAQFALFFGTLASARKTTTGFSFYQLTEKIQKNIAKLEAQYQFDCHSVWGGKGLPPPNAIE